MPIASKKIVAPSEIAGAISSFKEAATGGKNAAVLLGNFAQQHPQAAQIHAAAQALARDAKVGFLGEAANSVGGYVAGLPAGGDVRDAAEEEIFAAPERRARARFRRPAHDAGGDEAGRLRGAAERVQDGPRLRARAAADRAVHRDRRHVRQHRGPRAELPRHRARRLAKRARPGRCCACWAACSAGRTSTFDTIDAGARRLPCAAGMSPGCFPTKYGSKGEREGTPAVGHPAHRRRADLLRRSAGAPLARRCRRRATRRRRKAWMNARAGCRSWASPRASRCW